MVNINEIMQIIPHRYPLLLIDRIIEITAGKSIIGIKNVTSNEPQFTGHFPEKPIMPGVLIIEAMAQVSAVLVAKSMSSISNKEVLFMSINETKFRKIVTPGDQLIIKSEMMQNRGPVWKFKAKSEVEGEVVAESIFTAMVKDKEKE